MTTLKSCQTGLNHSLRLIFVAFPYAVGGLLLAAAFAKLYPFWSPVILGVAEIDAVIAVLVPSAELAIAIYLLWKPRKREGISAALVLFSLFTVYLIVMGNTGEGACSCGAGEQFFKSPSAKFIFSLARNVGIIGALAGYLVFLRRGEQPSHSACESAA